MSDALSDVVRPHLPDGWRCEPMAGRRGIVVVACWFGSVTIDFERREFRLGVVVSGRAWNTEAYEGRGWRDRIVEDAVACLDAADPGDRR